MIKIKNISFLHFCILLYTMTTILSKVAAGYSFLSVGYILVFSAMIINLGVYAILWQQAIKPFNASVAYSNKSVTTIWTLIFSNFIFKEGITFYNIIGAIMIILGVVLVVKGDE